MHVVPHYASITRLILPITWIGSMFNSIVLHFNVQCLDRSCSALCYAGRSKVVLRLEAK
jgi:hypothetical protein